MGPQRARKGRARKLSGDEEDEIAGSVVVLTSSDDDEANQDLSLDIVERARRRAAKRRKAEEGPAKIGSAVMDVSSSEEAEVVVLGRGEESGEDQRRKKKKGNSKEGLAFMDVSSSGDAEVVILDRVVGRGEGEKTTTKKKSSSSSKERKAKEDENAVEEKRKKKKKKREKEKVIEEEGKVDNITVLEQVPTANEHVQEEEPIGSADSAVTEVDEVADNVVLRKLLRIPRYFDPERCNWQSCYNCGEDGHVAANCTMEKRQKPCFVCGTFGHNAKNCTQGQDCFICKRRGHVAKDCPNKHKKNHRNSIICLQCGDVGHDMSSCSNAYSPDDLKEIQCYVCQKFGHLCCVDFVDTGSREVSCYNCGHSGHTGFGCAKPRWQTTNVQTPSLCYKCGEEGHFARGCTRKDKRNHDNSLTPNLKSKRSREFMGSRSAPHDLGKPHKKKKKQLDKRSMTAAKSRNRSHGDLDMRINKYKVNGWSSPSTPSNSGYRSSIIAANANYGYRPSIIAANANYSFSHSPWNPYPNTPSSSYFTGHNQTSIRASRFNGY